jgi:hypothetical protein
MFSTGRRRLPKHVNIVVSGELVSFSTMPGTYSWHLQNDASVVAPNAASSTMGSHEHGKKHVEATKTMRLGSGKPFAT